MGLFAFKIDFSMKKTADTVSGIRKKKKKDRLKILWFSQPTMYGLLNSNVDSLFFQFRISTFTPRYSEYRGGRGGKVLVII